ncbi:hypothetical protein CBL_20868 [Carabus blaptoides fortunei]
MPESAFCTSPVNSLHCVSGVTPFPLRRLRQGIKYTITIKSKPWHFLHDYLFKDERSFDLFLKSNTSLCPLAVTLLRKFDQLEFRLEEVLPLQISVTPTYCLPLIKSDLSLAAYKNEFTPPSIYVQEFKRLLQNYSESQQIFTDGSKIDRNTESTIEWLHRLKNPKLDSYQVAIKEKFKEAIEPFHLLALLLDPVQFQEGEHLNSKMKDTALNLLEEQYADYLCFRIKDTELYARAMFTTSVIQNLPAYKWWKKNPPGSFQSGFFHANPRSALQVKKTS